MDSILSDASFQCNNIECWFEMMFKVTEFVSVNNAHGINVNTKVVFDQPWLTRFKREMADQFTLADPKKQCPWITSGQTYCLACTYIFKHHFFSRDLDNVHKYTQDALASSININDSHIVELHTYKGFRPGDFEYLILRFGVSEYNYNQFR